MTSQHLYSKLLQVGAGITSEEMSLKKMSLKKPNKMRKYIQKERKKMDSKKWSVHRVPVACFANACDYAIVEVL